MEKMIRLSEVLGNQTQPSDVIRDFKKTKGLYEIFVGFDEKTQGEIIKFMTGQSGLEILYDPFFKYVMDPEIHQDRIESLISALFGEPVSIKHVLPTNGMRLSDQGTFVMMDIIVELMSGEIIDIEMQKVGYLFPAQRTSCYASDIVMRQYNRIRAQKKDKFSYKDISKAYLFIIMEKSSAEFLEFPNEYLHRRITGYSSGVVLPETVQIIYISLDTFRSTVQNVVTDIDAWLTFFSKNDARSIISLVNSRPEFAEYYKDIAEFRKKPEELLNMFSEALYIMDRNTERLMVDEMKREAEELKQETKELKQETKELKQETEELKQKNESLKSQVDEAIRRAEESERKLRNIYEQNPQLIS